MNLRKMLIERGFSSDQTDKAMVYSSLFEGDIEKFIHSVTEILEREDALENSPRIPSSGTDKSAVVSNHTGYGYRGSENFEHDDTGSQMNYSGVEDDVYTALSEHEDWEEGYDY